MKNIKILALMTLLVYASASNQNVFENGDRIRHYVGGSSEAVKFKLRENFSGENQREVASTGRFIRAIPNQNTSESSKQNLNKEFPKPYYFDYLVKEDPDRRFGNMHFHIQEKLENGTVKGVYGHAVREFGFIVVKYLADDKGYRATIERKEAVPSMSKYVGLSGERISGKVVYGEWGHMGVATAVRKLYTPEKDTDSNNSDEVEEF